MNNNSHHNRNKITTQSYFLSRIRDNGYVADRLFSNYGEHDPRVWTVIADPGGASVFITCMKNVDGLNTVYFELYDATQFVPGRLKINTDSIEVICSYLHDLGVINKSKKYDQFGPKRLWPIEEQSTEKTTSDSEN